MTAILTQAEAKQIWVAFSSLPAANHIKTELRSCISTTGAGIVVFTRPNEIHVREIVDYNVKTSEVYPSVLALATRYGLTR